MAASESAEPAFPADAVEVGRIIGPWGIQGAIKVKPLSADPQALFSSKRWFLQPPLPLAGAKVPPTAAKRAAAAAPVLPHLLRIIQARHQGDSLVATVDGFGDRTAAESLAGARIFISRASFPTPDADEFYWVDLIGLAVRNREGQELGRVESLIETGPTCVLRVVAEGEPAPDDVLIPFVAAYVDRVDLPGRCIHVDWLADY